MRAVAFAVLFISFITVEISCSGCSHSGRRSRQNKTTYQENLSNDESNRRTSRKEVEKIDQGSALTLNSLYKKYKDAVFMVYTSDGENSFQGSGFFISKEGLAVSNYHVFEGTSRGLEIIETLNGRKLKVSEILKSSEDDDFILFKVKLGNYVIKHPLQLVSQSPAIGEDVFAIGNPRGLESTLSKGIISGYRDKTRLIQTTAEITHGSSGGPLLNMRGAVVGITTAGLGEANLNFAINIHLLNLEHYK